MAASDEDPDTHLGELPDGAGCSEIWLHLSEVREPPEQSQPPHD